MGKFYAVRVGKKPGIYSNWDDCQAQVESFKGAIYKKFSTREEAEAFLKGEDAEDTVVKSEVKNDIVEPAEALKNLKEVTAKYIPNVTVNVTDEKIICGLTDKLALIKKSFDEALKHPIPIDELEKQEEVKKIINKYQMALSNLSFDENIAFVDGGGDKNESCNYESTKILLGVVLYDAKEKEFSLYRYIMKKDDGFDWLFRASNVAGEVMAALFAMYVSQKRGFEQIKIYQDNNLPAKYFSGAFKKINQHDDYALKIFINASIHYLEGSDPFKSDKDPKPLKINFLHVPSEHEYSKNTSKRADKAAKYESQNQIPKCDLDTALFLNAISDKLADYHERE